jgi:hypothetical protein
MWSASNDTQTPATGLSYNLRVGTTPCSSDIVSPMADVARGYRRVPGLGNAQMNLSKTLANILTGTTYYWSVQAIDIAFVGSGFATEGRLTVGPTRAFISLVLRSLL